MRLIFFILSALTVTAQPLVRSGWTTTTNPSTARASMGISETNSMGINVTNNLAGDTVTIGTGTNAVTLVATGGALAASDTQLIIDTIAANTISIGGDARTEWPTGGGGGTGLTDGGIELYLSYYTNGAPVSALTNLGLFTNGYYSAAWASTNGDGLSLESSPDAATWDDSTSTTNAVYLRLVVSLGSLNGGTPGVTNFSIYSIADLSVFGGTNDFRTTTVLIDEPTDEESPATKRYTDTVAVPRTWSEHPATVPVRLNGQPLFTDQAWELRSVVSNNELRLAFRFGGSTVAEFSPGFTAITNGAGVTIVDGAFMTVNVPTNQAPGPFRLLCSTNNLETFYEIAATNSYPSAVGTNYTLTFPKNPDVMATANLLYVGRSNSASASFPAQFASLMAASGTVNPTISTNQFTSFTTADAGGSFTASTSTDNIANMTAGRFRITAMASLVADGAATARMIVYTNGVPLTPVQSRANISTSYISMSAQGVVTLPANTAIDVRFGADAGRTYTFEHLSLVVTPL